MVEKESKEGYRGGGGGVKKKAKRNRREKEKNESIGNNESVAQWCNCPPLPPAQWYN
jgi:hypothetical protein